MSNTQKKNVPELRFPGFEGEWEEKKLGEVTDRVIRKNKNLESKKPLTISGQLGLIDQTEYFSKSVSSKNLENYTLIKNGEFAYNKSYSNGYPLGAIKRLTRYDSGVLSSLYICFSIKSEMSKDFMEAYFDSTHWYREVSGIAVEGARNHGLLNVSVNDFFTILIKYPSLEEQQKIGKFFSKLDRQIELEEQKLELLQQQKKGYMQKIFSQELRFKDENGNDYPESLLYKLSDIGTFNTGIGFPESLQGGKEGIPFFKISDMNNKGNEIIMRNANNYVSNGIIESKKWKIITNVPSMIFAKVGAAIMLNRKRLVLEPFLIDNNTMSYSFSQEWNINFGRTLFQTIYLPKYAQVGALPSYNAKDIGLIKIELPVKEEQKRIGDFFVWFEELIERQILKLDLLKERKRAILQKMFI
ncbi:TPA: restriction endonuclease subunit S [Staphylococcus aureus]|nr:restriction endonuclease subunit S [Staphylococcus aureus]EJN0120570.1 restriction endonuclease subunit S [Staphylococcus aureus]KKI66347.1 Type I restriction-modification system, specificity subunit S [Staphylococcus aureus]MCG5713979.1 restriction endonuclease subunit S [Staphylococcus aureus]MCQ1519249.1 restriction endonuclease subunit S [Staphylococcus aureus]MCV9434003.1 restriction endonuclease subunit S [Staphylococcus aureus]